MPCSISSECRLRCFHRRWSDARIAPSEPRVRIGLGSVRIGIRVDASVVRVGARVVQASKQSYISSRARAPVPPPRAPEDSGLGHGAIRWAGRVRRERHGAGQVDGRRGLRRVESEDSARRGVGQRLRAGRRRTAGCDAQAAGVAGQSLALECEGCLQLFGRAGVTRRLWPRSRGGGHAAWWRRLYRLRMYTGTTLSVLIQVIAGVQGCRARCGTCLLETPVAAEAEGEGGARWPPRGAVPLVEADVPLAVVRAIRSRAKPGRPSELTLLTTRVREAREILLEFGEMQRRHNHLRDFLRKETHLSLLQRKETLQQDWGSAGGQNSATGPPLAYRRFVKPYTVR